MEQDVLENYNKYCQRKALYKSFGYDIDQERSFILEQGKILEAGTGKGHFALCLAQAGYSFVTFDISPREQRFPKLNVAYCGFEQQVDCRIEI